MLVSRGRNYFSSRRFRTAERDSISFSRFPISSCSKTSISASIAFRHRVRIRTRSTQLYAGGNPTTVTTLSRPNPAPDCCHHCIHVLLTSISRSKASQTRSCCGVGSIKPHSPSLKPAGFLKGSIFFSFVIWPPVERDDVGLAAAVVFSAMRSAVREGFRVVLGLVGMSTNDTQ